MGQEQVKKPGTADFFPRGIRWLWRFFSSVKLAIVLILIITGLSLIGAFLIQVPPEIAHNPQAYQYWVGHVAADQVRRWAPLLSLFQLFNVFDSFWFLGAGALLMLNIIVCSLNRWGNIRSGLRRSTARHPESFFTGGKSDAHAAVTLPVPEAEAARLAAKVLRGRHYRVAAESDAENIYLAADKNRHFRLATYVSHLSLILFILAFIFGNLMGWRVASFPVSEGAPPQPVGHNSGLSLRLDSFTVAYYDNGMPRDYRSQVTLFENGREVREALVRVNHPLEYKGIRFYQSAFGPVVQLRISQIDTTANTTTPVYHGAVMMSPMGGQMSGYYAGYVNLTGQDYTAYILRAADPNDPHVPGGSVGVEIIGSANTDLGFFTVPLNKPTVIEGLEFVYSGDAYYSGFQVSSDPTNTLIWVASGLFMLGISLVLYFPYRQVWVWSRRDGERSCQVLIRTIAPRRFNDSAEVNALRTGLEKQLSTNRGAEK